MGTRAGVVAARGSMIRWPMDTPPPDDGAPAIGPAAYFRILMGKMPSLFFGLFLYSIGILCTIHAGLGVSPWDVFHIGLTKHTSLSLGQASQLTGLAVLGLSCLFKAIPGIASVLNMVFIGVFLDAVGSLGLFRTPDSLPLKALMLAVGMLIIGWASFFYLRVRLGAGPRDGLMEGLVRSTGLPVWAVRGAIELLVLVIGWLLGGPVGAGTVLTAGLIGASVQLAFRLGRYDPTEGRHENLLDSLRRIAAALG